MNEKFSSENINKINNIKINNKHSRHKHLTNELNCNIKFINNLSINYNKNTFVDIINILGKKRLIKKEIKRDKDLPEYIFVTTYVNKIKKNNMDNFINLPLQILDCKSSKIYMYKILDHDYNNLLLSKFTYKVWIKNTLFICLTIYYINNVLGIYHNDLCYKNDIRNIMIKKNTKNIKIKVNDYIYETDTDYPVIIDFGQQNKIPLLRTLNFYINPYKKRKDYIFISEVFIIYYYSYKLFFNVKDYWDEHYDILYDDIAKKASNRKEFDNQIINFLFNLLNQN